VLGVKLHPWQRVALIRMLELLEDGSMRFRTVVLLVARQNGKSTLAQVLTIWLLCIWGWPLILGTAQDLDVAETLWGEVVDIVADNEELAARVANVVKTNGQKALVLDTGGKYKVKAANRKAGRGLSGNLVLLDELREHQSWDAWGAITKTTMARAEALIFALSNAGDATSRVLRYLRLMAHKALGDPDGIAAAEGTADAAPTQFDLDSLEDIEEDEDLLAELDEFEDLEDDLELDDLEQDEDTLCILEWSAAPGKPRTDREGWRWANPSLGYTIRMRDIASACRTDPEWVFRTEVLCQWNDGASNGPFSPGQWEATTLPTELDAFGRKVIKDRDANRIVGPVVAGVAQQTGRSRTFICFAGRRADGRMQVELVTARTGTDWVEEWLASPDRTAKILAVGGQSNSAPESTLLRDLDESRTFRIPVVPLNGPSLTDAYGDTDDAIRDETVWHTPNPELDLAAGTAEWKVIGAGARVLDSKASPLDITALRAFVHALWLLDNLPAEPLPPPPMPQDLSTEDLDEDDDEPDFDPGDDWGDMTGDLGSAGF